MEYINYNLLKIREKIALDRLNAVVTVPLSINGVTSGNVTLPTVKSSAGAIQFTNDDATDTAANNEFKFDTNDSTLKIPGSVSFGSQDAIQSATSYIIFPDGTTQGTASTLNLLNGATFTGPISGSSLYLTDDLIVTGRIVTSTGIFGATANALIEPVDDMIMDGGEF